MKNRKMIKCIVDIAMLICMLILMCYQETGNHWHEIVGIGMCVVFLIHCILNGSWFTHWKQVIRQAGKSPASFLGLLINVLLIIDFCVLTISSIFISKDIFSFLGINGGAIWSYLHRATAYGGFILISIHLGVHWKLIWSGICGGCKINRESTGYSVLTKIAAIAFVVLGVFSSFRQSIGQKILYHSNGQYKVQNASMNKTAATVVTENADKSDSLEEFLGKLTCSGCGKHCSLLSPQCGRGQRRAEEATQSYHSGEAKGKVKIYGDDNLLKAVGGYIPIMGMYICGTYYVIELLKKKR